MGRKAGSIILLTGPLGAGSILTTRKRPRRNAALCAATGVSHLPRPLCGRSEAPEGAKVIRRREVRTGRQRQPGSWSPGRPDPGGPGFDLSGHLGHSRNHRRLHPDGGGRTGPGLIGIQDSLSGKWMIPGKPCRDKQPGNGGEAV